MRMDWRQRIIFGVWIMYAIIGLGCAQNTETPSEQTTDQRTASVTDTSQQAQTAADGPRNAINVFTNPHGTGVADSQGADWSEDLPADRKVLNGDSDAELAIALRGGQPGSNYSITIGDVSVVQGEGSAANEKADTTDADTAGELRAEQTPTVTATQDIRARIAVEVAAALAPGGAIHQALQTTAGEGDGPVMDAATQQDLQRLFEGGRVTPDALETLLPALVELLDRQNGMIEDQADQPDDSVPDDIPTPDETDDETDTDGT